MNKIVDHIQILESLKVGSLVPKSLINQYDYKDQPILMSCLKIMHDNGLIVTNWETWMEITDKGRAFLDTEPKEINVEDISFYETLLLEKGKTLGQIGYYAGHGKDHPQWLKDRLSALDYLIELLKRGEYV